MSKMEMSKMKPNTGGGGGDTTSHVPGRVIANIRQAMEMAGTVTPVFLPPLCHHRYRLPLHCHLCRQTALLPLRLPPLCPPLRPPPAIHHHYSIIRMRKSSSILIEVFFRQNRNWETSNTN